MCFHVARAYLSSEVSSSLSPTTNEASKETVLKGRISIHWRMIPPLVAMIASIAAIVYCVMMGHFYLTILFTAGLLGSIYALYLAHQYKYLKTFGENNESFSGKLKVLEDELKKTKETNEELKKTSDNLKNLLDQAEKTAMNLATQLQSLHLENETLKSSISLLEKTSDALAKERDQYKTLHAKHISQLEHLSSTFGTIHSEAFKQSSDLKFQVSTFKNVVDNFKQTQTSIDSNFEQTYGIVDDVKAKMAELLLKQAEFVNTITSHEQYIAFSDSVRRLESQANEQKNQLAVSKIQLETNQKLLEDLTKQVEAQKKLNEQLKTNMQRMSAQTQRMENSANLINIATDGLISKKQTVPKPYHSSPVTPYVFDPNLTPNKA